MVTAPDRFRVFDVVVLALVALVISVGLGAASAHAQPVPPVQCVDELGRRLPCPDLIVDAPRLGAQILIERATFTRKDCAVIEDEVSAGRRKLLRFTFATPNLGPGDLVVGNPSDHPEWFDFLTCHRHPHFKEFADYRLWTIEGYIKWQDLRRANPDTLPSDLLARNPDVAAQMVSGRKFGFCTIDSAPYLATPGPAKYTSCTDNQGISVGWEDVYGYQLDGQWIDITDVAPGSYMLEGEVNAERFFEETNYSNNSAAVPVTIPGKNGR